MPTRIWTVDAFADSPFSGNPAGVCLLDAPAPEAWMRAVAAEMNLAETAFLSPAEDGFALRWFTPVAEVELCGHATLASAHVLWTEGVLPFGAPASFHTLSGLLSATTGEDGLIWLDFPAETGFPAALPDGVAGSLGATPLEIMANRMDYLVELDGEDAVRNLAPDLRSLRSLDCRGVIVTSRASSPGVDFVSRFFAPAVGIDEDPVTGSAHCFLGPYWGQRLGKTELTGYQASRRGARFACGCTGSAFCSAAGRSLSCAANWLRPRPESPAFPARPMPPDRAEAATIAGPTPVEAAVRQLRDGQALHGKPWLWTRPMLVRPSPAGRHRPWSRFVSSTGT